ncbi:MAG: hypothetical protein KDA99_08535, partial [Planctomycetales bacterium]|nr:hypothetical protein [Planctomycetales bacterium]
MEKIKAFFRYIKRQQFWLICTVIVILGCVIWFMTTRELAAERKKNEDTINSNYSTVQTMTSQAQAPNEKVAAAMTELIETRKSQVEEAWREKYKQQETILVWPTDMTPEFQRAVVNLKPIETVTRELPAHYREQYSYFIERELPKLAERIHAKWKPANDPNMGGGMMGGGRGGYGSEGGGYGGGTDDWAGDETDTMMMGRGGYGSEGGGYGGGLVDANGNPIVDDGNFVKWHPGNQGLIQFEHFSWPETQSKVPTTKQMLYAQEDLWVLTSLMDVIAQTNENATGAHNAVIKRIEFIHIGKDVSPSAGKVSAVKASAVDATMEDPMLAGSGGYGTEGGAVAMDAGAGASLDGGRSPYGGYGSEMGSGGALGADGMPIPIVRDPAEKRYVDKDYQQLTSEQLKEAIESSSPDTVYLAVAKRMAVRMRFYMDQRGINRLLLACANSPLTVEVRQVRLFRDKKLMDAKSSPFGDMFGGMGGM